MWGKGALRSNSVAVDVQERLEEKEEIIYKGERDDVKIKIQCIQTMNEFRIEAPSPRACSKRRMALADFRHIAR